MPQTLVRLPDDTYVEYFYDSTHGVFGDFVYPSTDNLLSYGTSGDVVDEDGLLLGGYAPDEVLPLCANFASWVLAVGLDYDIVFIGHNAEGNVLIHGDYDRFRISQDSRFLDIAQIVQGIFAPDDPEALGSTGRLLTPLRGLTSLPSCSTGVFCLTCPLIRH